MKKLEVLLGGLTFPEAPRWHEGRLWFSDFYSHRVMAVDMNGRAETIVEVPNRPSGLGWTPAGDLLIVSMLDRRVLRFDGKRLTELADLSGIATGPCNDMVVDSAGRAYVGNFGYDRHQGEAARTTCLARVDPDGRVTRVAEEMVFPNGMVITPDGKTLVVAETFAERLTAFNIAADGALSNRRVFAHIPGSAPDGICLDVEGAIWVSNPKAHRVDRVFDGGRIAGAVDTGALFSYACMLGGPSGRSLFVLTNSGSGPAMAERADGRVEIIEVEVAGAGLP